jgi:predicted SnoaL-like aldol condensation-catalyzing enzyme
MGRFLLAVLLAVSLWPLASPASASDMESARSKAVVLAFYKLALQDFRPDQAFQRYGSPSFVEHSQDTAGSDSAATVKFLQRLIARSAKPRWQVVRTIAEGDLVFVHVRYTPDPGGPEVAVAEVFRVQDGKIAEHWDVISPPPDEVTNPASRF